MKELLQELARGVDAELLKIREDLTAGYDSLGSNFDERMATLLTRLESAEAKLEAIGKTVEALEPLAAQIAALDPRLGAVETAVNTIGALADRVQALEDAIPDVATKKGGKKAS
jgi:prefoldin subunit 5